LAIVIAPVLGFVEHRQREETIFDLTRRGRWLLGVIAEQLGAVCDHAIRVTVKNEKCVVRTNCRPRDLLVLTIAIHIKRHAVVSVCQMIAVTENIDNDRSLRFSTVASFFIPIIQISQSAASKRLFASEVPLIARTVFGIVAPVGAAVILVDATPAAITSAGAKM